MHENQKKDFLQQSGLLLKPLIYEQRQQIYVLTYARLMIAYAVFLFLFINAPGGSRPWTVIIALIYVCLEAATLRMHLANLGRQARKVEDGLMLNEEGKQ